MKISIITPTFNSEDTISKNIKSVISQEYEDWEQIIIDNISTDNTLSIVKKIDNEKIKIFSQKDNGIFDAINKGISLSSGEIISILHSDDYFYSIDTLNHVIKEFSKEDINIIYGDIIYTKKNNTESLLRYWKSNKFIEGNFYKGWSPPHPGFFVKKKIHEKFGNYSVDLGNSSDFELMFRLLEKNKVQSRYINKILVGMRYGGVSNKSYINILKQNLQIIKILGIKKNYIKILRLIFYKIFNRIIQFLSKPKKK